MKDGKLFYLLKQLNEEEFKGLKKAIASPLLNTNPRMLQLYQALRIDFPVFEYTDKYLCKLYKKVFKGEAYNHNKLHKLFSAFCRVIEEYLLLLEIREDDYRKKKWQFQLYGKRGMTPYFEKTKTALAQALTNRHYRDAHYFLEQFQLNDFYYNHKKGVTLTEAFQASNDLLNYLDQYYFNQKLKLACTVKSAEKFLKQRYSVRLLEEVLQQVEKEAVLQQPQVILLQLLIELFNTGVESDYWKAKEVFFGNYKKLNQKEIYLVLGYLLNYTINQGNLGKNEFIRENFELNQKGIEYGWLIDDNIITNVLFLNIVINGARLKEWDWTYNFIREYEFNLVKESRTDVKNFSLGLFYSYKEEHETVIDLLLNYSFSNALIALRAKSLLLRTYFDLSIKDSSYWSLFLNYNIAFQQYLRRSKNLDKTRIKRYLYYSKILNKIYDYYIIEDFDSSIKSKLLAEINEKPLVFRHWIEQKLKG